MPEYAGNRFSQNRAKYRAQNPTPSPALASGPQRPSAAPLAPKPPAVDFSPVKPATGLYAAPGPGAVVSRLQPVGVFPGAPQFAQPASPETATSLPVSNLTRPPGVQPPAIGSASGGLPNPLQRPLSPAPMPPSSMSEAGQIPNPNFGWNAPSGQRMTGPQLPPAPAIGPPVPPGYPNNSTVMNQPAPSSPLGPMSQALLAGQNPITAPSPFTAGVSGPMTNEAAQANYKAFGGQYMPNTTVGGAYGKQNYAAGDQVMQDIARDKLRSPSDLPSSLTSARDAFYKPLYKPEVQREMRAGPRFDSSKFTTTESGALTPNSQYKAELASRETDAAKEIRAAGRQAYLEKRASDVAARKAERAPAVRDRANARVGAIRENARLRRGRLSFEERLAQRSPMDAAIISNRKSQTEAGERAERIAKGAQETAKETSKYSADKQAEVGLGRNEVLKGDTASRERVAAGSQETQLKVAEKQAEAQRAAIEGQSKNISETNKSRERIAEIASKSKVTEATAAAYLKIKEQNPGLPDDQAFAQAKALTGDQGQAGAQASPGAASPFAPQTPGASSVLPDLETRIREVERTNPKAAEELRALQDRLRRQTMGNFFPLLNPPWSR